MELRLPNIGEDTESGTVASIFVKEGDTIEKDQALIELESEKAIASVPSTTAGTVTRVHVQEGDEIRVGAVIVSIDAEATSAAPFEEAQTPETTVPAEPQVRAGTPSAKEPETAPPTASDVAPVASPSIRKMGRELGIDLSRVRGTGRGGRIVLGDLRNYIERLQQVTSESARSKPVAPSVDFSRWGPVKAFRASSIRKTIAARMGDSWATVPHVAQFGDADITNLMAHRRKYVPVYKAKDARLTLTPIVLKAVVQTLARHPLLNSSLDEASVRIVTKEYCHIGLAVDTEAGLIVPVIRNVDQKSVLELAREIEELSERTRQRKVSKDELQGGTFTVSNQGGIGGGHFTPIINKPEVAILGIGRGREVLQLRDGQVEARTLLPLTVCHDHRVVDGADGVRFLVDLVETLEGFPEAELKID